MNSFNNQDMQIIAHLRQDARKNLTIISKQTLVPISTVFDKLKKYNLSLIKKNTIIIDFKKLGFELRVNILVKTAQEKREELKNFLEKCLSINNVYRINNGYDFMIEAVFRNMIELEEFHDRMESIGIIDKKEFYILEDIKIEGFMSEPTLVKMLKA
jgi:Lrp/AsnC family transcriptional regulator for asnA, asnC and gidA